MTPAECHLLLKYIRDNFFRRLKLIDNGTLQKMESQFFKVLQIDEDQDKQDLYRNEVYKIVRSTLSKRRNYVTQRVRQHLRGEYKNIFSDFFNLII